MKLIDLKYKHEVTKERPQSRSTTFPSHYPESPSRATKRRRDKKQMMERKTSHMKPPTYAQ